MGHSGQFSLDTCWDWDWDWEWKDEEPGGGVCGTANLGGAGQGLWQGCLPEAWVERMSTGVSHAEKDEVHAVTRNVRNKYTTVLPYSSDSSTANRYSPQDATRIKPQFTPPSKQSTSKRDNRSVGSSNSDWLIDAAAGCFHDGVACNRGCQGIRRGGAHDDFEETRANPLVFLRLDHHLGQTVNCGLFVV